MAVGEVANGAMKQTMDAVLKFGGTTVNSCGGTANGVGQVTVNTGNPTGMAMEAKIGIATAVLVAAWKIGTEVYDRYVSKDDAKLLQKFIMKDCGGLSTMPIKVEGCFRKYLTEAIHRLAQKAPWDTTAAHYGRFNECFENRKEYPCDWEVDVFG